MRNQQTMCQILCDLLNLENKNILESTIKKISNKDQQTLSDIQNFYNIVLGKVKLFDFPTYKTYGNPQTEDGGYRNYILSVIQSYMFINKTQPLPPETLMLMVYYVYNYLLLKKDVTKPQNQENIQLIIDNILACKNNTSLTVEPPVSKLLGDFLEKSANIGPLGQKVLPIYFIGEESFGDDFGIFSLRDTSGTITKITFKQELIDTIIQGKEFAPEFINRFTEVIVYYPLQLETVSEIAAKMIEILAERFDQERGVKLEIEPAAIAYLAEKGYSPDFGARELERTVSSKLETYLANYLLINQVKRGDHIIITRDNIII
jgi:hypothetical protein